MKINQLIVETSTPSVGRKYQHIEDLILSHGSHGGLHAVERLRHMAAEGNTIETKWDGSPVVYWGRNEKGEFSLIPKNAWAYLKSGKTQTATGAPTIMKSPRDIEAFILGTGSGDPQKRTIFAKQFASLWPYFEKISPKQGFLEGGLLFYPGNKPDGSSAMPELNEKTKTYDFTPNITTFHVPVDSDLGKRIANAKLMVAATGFYPTIGSSEEQRYANAEKLSVPGIIVQGTTYVQEPVNMDSKALDRIEAYIKQNASKIDNYLSPKQGLSNPSNEIYSYLNKRLRTTGLLADFSKWVNEKLSEKKANLLLNDYEGMKATLGALEAITKQKNILINQVSQGTHGGIKQTKPEGYAQAHPGAKFKYDIPGQFIKAIDQTNWKPRESVMEKAKQTSKPIVVGWGRGMGHTGHDALVNAVIHQAAKTGATPYFVVSRSFGKDDPIPPETKLKMYQKKFPKYANMFSLTSAENPTLNDVLANMAKNGTTDVTLIVGADQKEAFGYLTRPDKSGVEPYKNFGLNSLTIMSRQDTKAPGSDPAQKDYHEGPRATPMREVLLDPNKTEQEQFAVWRQAMSPSLDDKEVYDMMMTAKQNLIQFHTPKPRRKASDIKEYISRIRPLLKEATTKQRMKIVILLREAKKQLDASQLVVEGYDNAEAFKAHLIKSLPQIMKLFANVGKGWTPSKEQMLAAVDTGYQVMKHTGDTKQAGKAVMDELNTLYRMSQGEQSVSEGQVNEYTVRNTKKFIQRAHDTEQGQKYGSAPYSRHPKAVANIGKKFFGTQFTSDAVKVALLHDVLEDTPYTPRQLAKKGFSKEIIQAVQLLTKNKNLSYVDNIKNIINSGNKLAMMVKYSDNYMNFIGDKSHWESDRAIQSNKKYLASLNMLGDVLGIKKHLGSADTNVTESSDYLDEK